MINWKEYITSNEDVLGGKLIIKETRLSVEFILERLANDCSHHIVSILQFWSAHLDRCLLDEVVWS